MIEARKIIEERNIGEVIWIEDGKKHPNFE